MSAKRNCGQAAPTHESQVRPLAGSLAPIGVRLAIGWQLVYSGRHATNEQNKYVGVDTSLGTPRRQKPTAAQVEQVAVDAGWQLVNNCSGYALDSTGH
jgi:hypothetical protein